MSTMNGFAGVSVGKVFDRYIGSAKFDIVAVMPTKEELEALGFQVDEEPVYLSEKKDENTGEVTTQLRVALVFRAKDENDKEVMFRHNIFLGKKALVGKDSGKIQVIDQYGRTAWVTEEQFNSKLIPTYTDKETGKEVEMQITSEYRKTFVGEEELVGIIRIARGTSDAMYYDRTSKTRKYINDLSKALCRLPVEMVVDLFTEKGIDIIRSIIPLNTNQVKLFAIMQKNSEGKLINSLYTRRPMRASDKLDYHYNSIIKDMAKGNIKDEFEIKNLEFLRIYNVQPTSNPQAAPTASPYEEQGAKMEQPQLSPEQQQLQDVVSKLPF